MNVDQPKREDLSDLGFGSRVAQDSLLRFLNRDGSFNVRRKRLPFRRRFAPYHYLVTISWPRFYTLVIASYLLFNVLFAEGYYLAGRGSLSGEESASDERRFLDDFFFSVQTSTTIGYGRIAPVGIASNILASAEALAGLLGFALATSLMFVRFSQPNARIVYSDNAIVAPYRGIRGLMFRIANERNNQMIKVGVQVLLSRMEPSASGPVRRFHPLALERDEVMFFPLTWTVVHPIDERSPMRGLSEEEFRASDPELLVLLNGIDDTFAQIVYSRSSYKGHEIVWGAKFSDVFEQDSDGELSVNLHRIHLFDRITLA
jgi:inward rectifier potassium channel